MTEADLPRPFSMTVGKATVMGGLAMGHVERTKDGIRYMEWDVAGPQVTIESLDDRGRATFTPEESRMFAFAIQAASDYAARVWTEWQEKHPTVSLAP